MVIEFNHSGFNSPPLVGVTSHVVAFASEDGSGNPAAVRRIGVQATETVSQFASNVISDERSEVK